MEIPILTIIGGILAIALLVVRIVSGSKPDLIPPFRKLGCKELWILHIDDTSVAPEDETKNAVSDITSGDTLDSFKTIADRKTVRLDNRQLANGGNLYVQFMKATGTRPPCRIFVQNSSLLGQNFKVRNDFVS